MNRNDPTMNPLPHAAGSAWMINGLVLRRLCRTWQVRKDNGSGWGNGDLLNQFGTRKAALAFISAALLSARKSAVTK